MEFKWRSVSMQEAFDDGVEAGGSAVDQNAIYPNGFRTFALPKEAKDSSPSVLLLKNGSVILSESRWTGPYSEVTPDIDAEWPEFWIGEPCNES